MYKMDRKGGGLRQIFLEEITGCYAWPYERSIGKGFCLLTKIMAPPPISILYMTFLTISN